MAHRKRNASGSLRVEASRSDQEEILLLKDGMNTRQLLYYVLYFRNLRKLNVLVFLNQIK